MENVMRSKGNGSVRSLLFAAALFAVPCVLTDIASASEPETVAVSPARALARAEELVEAGKLIQARNMADTAMKAGDRMSDEEWQKCVSLMSRIEAELRTLPDVQVRLQKAEAAMIVGDLRSAEAHANWVLISKTASESERASAQAVIDLVKQRREDLAPMLRKDLHTAVDDYLAGDYAAAKSKLDRVAMSGIELSVGERALFEQYAGKLRDMAVATGDVSLGFAGGMDDEKTDWLLQPEQESGQDQPVDPIQESQRNEAMRMLAEADEAYRQGNYLEAQTKYNRLISQFAAFLSQDDLNHAQSQADRAALQLRGQPSGGVLDETRQELEQQRSRARSMFAAQLNQVRDALATGDFATAMAAAAQAQLTANQNRNVLPEDEYQSMLDQAAEALSRVNEARTAAENAERERIEAELERLTQERDAAQQAERERKINEMIARIRALQLDLKYDEALQVVDQILVLDPLNPAGLLLRDVLEDSRIYYQYYHLQRDKHLSYTKHTIENERALIAPESIIGYPSDWPTISFKRGEPMQFSESAQNRAVLTALQEKRIPVSFQDNTFADVMKFFEQVSGLNIDIDWESLELIGVDQESPVTLKLTNVTLETVLDRVLEKVSDPDIPAGWAVTDGILTIASDEVLRRNTVLEIYDIRDLLIDVPDYTEAPDFDLNTVLQSTGRGGGGGRSPFQGGGQQQDVERRDRQEMIDEIIDI
ncbi:MAG: hypothetical protein D6695_10035, partial [Planctomycetota bacterium]